MLGLSVEEVLLRWSKPRRLWFTCLCCSNRSSVEAAARRRGAHAGHNAARGQHVKA